MINVDSTIHDPLLGACEAARLLGIKLATLYAYASRGLLESVPSGRGRSRLYPRSAVERLRARRDARAGHGPVAAGALRWGEPVLDTAITAIGPGGPVYRGEPAVALAERGAPFEGVAELLWGCGLVDSGPWADDRRALALLGRVGRPPSVFDALAAVIPLAAWADSERVVATPARELARARSLIATSVSAVALALGRPRPPPGPVASRLAQAIGAPARAARLVECALVLMADHELNASSFAARVAASTGADLYACVAAAVAALSGPRHGGEAARVQAAIAEARTPRGASGLVAGRVGRQEELPGFGHPLYPDGDPRAALLLGRARVLGASRLAVVDAFVGAAERLRGVRPNVDVGLVAAARAASADPQAPAALFAIGRLAGWIAHAWEQRAAGHLLRPRARYVGAP